MKKTILIFAVLSIIAADIVVAQEWETLFYVYAESVRRPLQFDEYIESNKKAFNKDFNKCTSSLYNKLWPRAQKHIEFCNQYANPDWRNKCMQENPEADAAMWVASIYMRVNKGTPWCQTSAGELQCFGEQICHQQGLIDCSALKEMMLTQFGELVAPYFICP